ELCHHRVAPSGGDDLCAVKRLSHGVPASSTPHRPVPGYPSPASFILAYGDFRDWENEFSYTMHILMELYADTYQCPAGERLTFHFATVELGRHIRYYATSACKACALKQKCRRNTGGRRLTRRGGEEPIEDMARRVDY